MPLLKALCRLSDENIDQNNPSVRVAAETAMTTGLITCLITGIYLDEGRRRYGVLYDGQSLGRVIRPEQLVIVVWVVDRIHHYLLGFWILRYKLSLSCDQNTATQNRLSMVNDKVMGGGCSVALILQHCTQKPAVVLYRVRRYDYYTIMVAATTGIGFSLLSLGLAFCGLRFFRAFQKIGDSRAGNKIGILLSVLHFGFALVNGLLAVGTILFATNLEMLYIFLLAAHFFLTAVAVIGVYLVFYILFPSISPWPGAILAGIVGIAVIILTMATRPHPFIDASGGIDWNFSRWLSILLAYLLFLAIGSFFAIFAHSFLRAKSREVRVVSFILAALAIIGIVNVLVRFLFSDGAISDFLRTRIFDATLAFIGIIFIGVFALPPIIIGWLSRTKNE